ncbi:MAG: GIY-YIG nuclease family protein, partial [Pseudorhodoplanes sp.]
MNGRKTDIDPEIELADEDEDATLPEAEPLDLSEGSSQSLAAGRAAIERYAKNAPMAPGVYRMVDAGGEVLYVGKAKSIKKRITSYARPTGHDTRIERMIAAT